MDARITEERLEDIMTSRWMTNNGFQDVQVSNRQILIYATTVDSNGHNFNQSGNCGYVAGGLLVYFARGQRGWWDLAPHGLNRELVNQIQGNRPGPSSAWDVSWALDDYFRSIGSGVRSTWWTYPAMNFNMMFDQIRSNRAVALFGNLPNASIREQPKTHHAVVVHRMTRAYSRSLLGIRTYRDHILWAHYGWSPRFNNQELHRSLVTLGSLLWI